MTIKTVAVIGAGRAGREFAAACASAGFAVVLEDVMPARLRQAQEQFATVGANVRLVSTVEDAVREAEIAVDFVPDELESKLEIWSLIDRMAPPRTVLCTPSDVLSVTDLASCTYRADRCVMMRGDLRVGGAVRLLLPREVSATTSESALEMLRALGCNASTERDPDLPMLLRNMRAATL